jgi:RNA recognition motif-containing protein
MSNKLFVGGLSWGTDNDGLRNAFSEFGQITDVHVATDRDTGRSRGFGFVTFETSEEAQSALSAMNGQQLDGRELRVDTAQQRAPRNGGGRDRRY